MWLDLVLAFLALVVLDVAVRAFLKVDAMGDYRKRHHEIGKGSKQLAITLLGASSIYGEGSDVEIPFAVA